MTEAFAPIREPIAPPGPTWDDQRTGPVWADERTRQESVEQPEEEREPERPSYETGGTGKAAAVMAAGTVLSRLTGFIRIALLAAVVGAELRNDLFTVANTIPNSLYILLAGGIFNTVLVPQLVRAIKHHRDGGQEYTDRLMTAGLLVLAVLTTVCVVIAPLIARLYMPHSLTTPEGAAQRAEIEFFTRLCLPQIFFYGAYVLVGQVLNARQRFGPMMWAPIANNVVAIGTILLFWSLYGAHSQPATYSDSESLLLGLGHTAGIAVQLLVLLPYLRASGYHYRPRFGLRDTGLGRTARLGLWTVLFVAVNQVTLIVVTRLALAGTSGAGSQKAAGVFAYSTSMLMFLVPHGIVTVSLATAILPRLSAQASDGDVEAVARDAAATTRQALAVVVPAAIAMFAFAFPLMSIVAGYGSAKGRTGLMSLTLMALALGLLPFTVQYLQLRTFYAFEDTRTPFLIQCGIAAVNIAAALIGVRVLLSSPRLSAIALGAAFSLAYLTGAFVSRAVLRRRVPPVEGAEVLVPLLSMVIAATLAAGCGVAIILVLNIVTEGTGPLYSALLLIVAGGVMLPVYAGLARVLHISEVSDLIRTITSRLPGRTGRA
jgi:putative peptidoglycan lipid II flippase